MDDRDLEARLRTHLHGKLDDARPSPELAAAVRQVVSTEPRPVRTIFTTRPSSVRVGFAVTAVAAVVGIVALAGSNLGRQLGPGGVSVPPSATAELSERAFVVLPPSGSEPEKPGSIAAGDVLSARLRAFGFGTFTMSGGYGMTFLLWPGGPSDDEIRAVLSATGDVSVVPLPPADYGVGKLTAVVHQPLPKAEPALLGRTDIASAALSVGSPFALHITLTPAAKVAFATFTAAHVGESFAILVDGRVLDAPTITAAIPDGVISTTPDVPLPALDTAILIGGELPLAWRNAPVPKTISIDRARALAAIESTAVGGSAVTGSTQLDAELVDGVWQAVWTVQVTGSFPYTCFSTACATPRTATATVKIDAVRGVPISVEVP